jgi:hypothetical protein
MKLLGLGSGVVVAPEISTPAPRAGWHISRRFKGAELLVLALALARTNGTLRVGAVIITDALDTDLFARQATDVVVKATTVGIVPALHAALFGEQTHLTGHTTIHGRVALDTLGARSVTSGSLRRAVRIQHALDAGTGATVANRCAADAVGVEHTIDAQGHASIAALGQRTARLLGRGVRITGQRAIPRLGMTEERREGPAARPLIDAGITGLRRTGGLHAQRCSGIVRRLPRVASSSGRRDRGLARSTSARQRGRILEQIDVLRLACGRHAEQSAAQAAQ